MILDKLKAIKGLPILQVALWLMALSFLGVTIYRGWFMKTITSKQEVIVQAGGTNIGQQSIEAEKKLKPWFEPYAQIDTHGEFEGGLRCGIRF